MRHPEDSYTVEVEDWGTKWKHRQENNFHASSGRVYPGRTRPLTTNFEALTLTQKLVLNIENHHYKVKELMAKCEDEQWMAVHGKEFHRDDNEG